MEEHELILGDLLEDRVTGIRGIATAKTEFLNGCIQVEVTPRLKKEDITSPEKAFGISIDIQQLKKVGVGLNAKKREPKELKGGPMRVLSKRAY